MRIVHVVVSFALIVLSGILVDTLILLGNTMLGSSECTVFTWDEIAPSMGQLIISAIGAVFITSSKVINWSNKYPKVLLIILVVCILLCVPLIFINLC